MKTSPSLDGRSFWKMESRKLIQAMRDSGVPVYVHEKRLAGFQVWWERVIMWVGNLVMKEGLRNATQVFYDRVYLAESLRLVDPPSEDHAKKVYSTLLHECTHILQVERLRRFFRWRWLAYLVWATCYAFALPAVFTLRARWEAEAYEDGYAPYVRTSSDAVLRRLVEHAEKLFKSPLYFWMDPFNAGGFKRSSARAKRIMSRAGRYTLVERMTGHEVPFSTDLGGLRY